MIFNKVLLKLLVNVNFSNCLCEIFFNGFSLLCVQKLTFGIHLLAIKLDYCVLLREALTLTISCL